MLPRAFIFTIAIFLMLGLSPGMTIAQEASGVAAQNTEAPTVVENSSENRMTEIFGQKYNAEELEIFNKLSPEQLHQLLMQKEQSRSERYNNTDWESIVLPPIIVGTVFFTPVLIVGCLVYFSYREKKLVHASIAKMVEKGMEIPPHLLIQQKKQKVSSPNADLKKGLILLATGLGVALFLNYTPGASEVGAWSLGLIPLFIGLAYLLFWKLDKPKGNASPTGLSE